MSQMQESAAFDWAVWKTEYEKLAAQELSADNLDQWMKDWTSVAIEIGDYATRTQLATQVNTKDEAAQRRFMDFIQKIEPEVKEAEQALSQKLVDSGLTPEGMEIPMRKLRQHAEMFRRENLPLQMQLSELGNDYNKTFGSQTVEWDGKEVPLPFLRRFLQDSDRSVREKSWRAGNERVKEDRGKINEIWTKMLPIRLKLAENAGFDNFLDYKWMDWGRFDYTLEDSREFQETILNVVVPFTKERMELRKEQLSYDSLRPWDLDVDPLDRGPLEPFADAAELEAGTERVFRALDPRLGDYVKTMSENKLFDLDSRDGKAPGGFMTVLDKEWQPFIFMNAVGIADDIRTMLHECGHAFHTFCCAKLPYAQQRDYPIEFAEVASMSMELVAGPYCTKEHGGFYSEADLARDRTAHLDKILYIWCNVAMGDAFQHWIYRNPQDASDPAKVSAKWLELYKAYLPAIDTTGIEDELSHYWHRILHFFLIPLYFIDYGLAQLGAVQVWANALKDEKAAVDKYLKALDLGGTAKLDELYAAAGAKLAFDEQPYRDAVGLIGETLAKLEAKQ